MEGGGGGGEGDGRAGGGGGEKDKGAEKPEEAKWLVWRR